MFIRKKKSYQKETPLHISLERHKFVNSTGSLGTFVVFETALENIRSLDVWALPIVWELHNLYFSPNTGRFIMFSVITNIYNKKTQRTYLNGIVHSHRKSDFFWQLEMFDVCTTGDTAHIDTIFKLLPHTRQHVDACVYCPIDQMKNEMGVPCGTYRE